MVPIDFLILKMVLKALTQHLDYILTGEDDIAAFVDGACIGFRVNPGAWAFWAEAWEEAGALLWELPEKPPHPDASRTAAVKRAETIILVFIMVLL